MRKIAVVFASILLIASNTFAGSGTSIDASSLTKAINTAKTTTTKNNSFAMVYGGKDISHNVMGSELLNQQILTS